MVSGGKAVIDETKIKQKFNVIVLLHKLIEYDEYMCKLDDCNHEESERHCGFCSFIVQQSYDMLLM